ncbi:unnamed protein product [Allacma fusca]|uniref:S-adenosylmethionine transporter n=3 Tax=Allacma fusca TaxID=39272 RepID=A0A8J2KID8_9HEXA|nr:unnamed protein product [Allacma fusca]
MVSRHVPCPAGSAAGTSVDVILFPLDTIKTRLQSSNGFSKSGGFAGIYRGLGPAFLGSAPNAAIFFCTYDTAKECFGKIFEGGPNHPLVHMGAASLGEIAACSIRVPVDIIKQRRQAFGHLGVTEILTGIRQHEGISGYYRGYASTIFREIPFAVIQFPLWEYLKRQLALRNGKEISPAQSAVSGAVAGGFSAFLTTPLDVAKTRIMLADTGTSEAQGRIITVWKIVYAESGMKGLYAGAIPRTLWISFGGSIFFGTYELPFYPM